MQTFYFTFGANQETKEGKSLGQCFVCIDAGDESQARFDMFDARGSSWSMCYTEEEFAGQPEKYGLTCVSLEYVSLC